MKKILVTCALPYANGDIHLGHLLEHIQADIWIRYQKNIGNKVYFISAIDAHGTAVMLKAQELNINIENMIHNMQVEHKKIFSLFNIFHDNYYTTHSKENRQLSYLIYRRLYRKGLITFRKILQFYDLQKDIYLSDRMIKGTCPKCHAKNQPGDNCENCGIFYKTIDIINPVSLISNTIPILRESKHFFFNLPKFYDMLKNWIYSDVLQKEVRNKVIEWFSEGLQEWDISRDGKYFGFLIPKEINKYFYVWLDAPIGYMSSFKNYCLNNKNVIFNEFWDIDSQTELYHFIGKDIIYFHALFWPSILEGSNFRKPTKLIVHGYINVNGYKMSKSRGTFITAKSYLKYFNSDSLRYYYASKLSININDIDLNLEDLMNKVNTDIVNNIVNLAARCASFINLYFDNYLSSKIVNPELYAILLNASYEIKEFFQTLNFNKVVRKILYLSDLSNKYISMSAPWLLIKNKNKKSLYEIHNICSMGINCFRIIMIYLQPIMPVLAKKSEKFLNITLYWDKTMETPLCCHKINLFFPLFDRIQKSQISDLLNEKH